MNTFKNNLFMFLILFITLNIPKSMAQVTVYPSTYTDLCLNTYQTLDPIKFSETAVTFDDFTAGTGKYMFLELSDGFSFDPTASITITTTNTSAPPPGSDLSNSSVLLITSNLIIIQYDVDATAKIDSVVLNGIKVKANALGTGTIKFATGSSAINGLTAGTTVFANLGTALTSMSFNLPISACKNAANIDLMPGSISSYGVAAGVTGSEAWSGTGVSTQYFSPTTASEGTHTLTYTVSTTSTHTGCNFSLTDDITVLTGPTVSVSISETSGLLDNDGIICSGSTISFSASGANSYKYYRTGAHVGSAATYSSSSFSNGETVYVEGTGSNGCTSNSSTYTITVNTAPATPTFNPSNNSFTTTDSPFWLDTLGTVSEESGRSSGDLSYFTGSGVFFQDNRYWFVPDMAGDGTHTITFHFVNQVTGCENTASKSIIVGTGVSEGVIKDLQSDYCVYDPIDTIYVDFTSFLGLATYKGLELSVNSPDGIYTTLSSYSSQTVSPYVTRYFYKIDPSLYGGKILYLRTKYSSVNLFTGTSKTYTSSPQISTINNRPSMSITNSFDKVSCSDYIPTPITYSIGSASGTPTFSCLSKTELVKDSSDGNFYIMWNKADSTLISSNYTIEMNFTDNITGCSNTTTKTIGIALKPSPPTISKTIDTFCIGNSMEGYVSLSTPNILGAIWVNSTNVISEIASYTDVTYPKKGYTKLSITNGFQFDSTYYIKQYRYSTCVSDLSNSYTIKANAPMVMDPGVYSALCSNKDSIVLTGFSKNYTGVQHIWSVDYTGVGSNSNPGFFDDSTKSAATYYFGYSDLLNESINFMVISSDPDGPKGCSADTAYTSLKLYRNPEIVANPNKGVYCSNEQITLNAYPKAGSISSYSWSLVSGGGTFTSPNEAVTNFDLTSILGNSTLAVTFKVTTNDPEGPCNAVFDDTTIVVNPYVTVDAGLDIAKCADQTFNLSGTVKIGGIDRTSNNLWKTYDGLGSFSNLDATQLTNTYIPSGIVTSSGNVIPGTGELGNGNTLRVWLVSDDPDGTGPCLADSDYVDITIYPLPITHFEPSTEVEYCFNSIPVKLYGNLGSTAPEALFKDKTGAGNFVYQLNKDYYFDALKTNVSSGGTYEITYQYTDKKGCVNFVDTTFRVYPIPDIGFTTTSVCQNDIITLSDNSSIKTDVYSSSANFDYKWNIDNNKFIFIGTSNQVVFDNYGDHSIILTVTSNSGGGINCTNTLDSTLKIGPYPDVNFDWKKSCKVDTTQFTNMTTIPIGFTFANEWDMIGTGTYTNGTNSTSLNPRYFYDNPGLYEVVLKATNNTIITGTTNITYNCKDSIIKEVIILPMRTVIDADPYMTTFRDHDSLWLPNGQNYSWEWGTPTSKKNFTIGHNTWMTSLSTDYNTDEKSFLNSPCFVFTDMVKPMIAMKIWSETPDQLAGVVLQSSIDGGDTWKTEGAVGDGINWYDNNAVAGQFGIQPLNQYAWNGNYGDWRVARLGLSNLSYNDKVRFRLAFGSLSDISVDKADGFAIDSVWIGERNKMLLLEHFTNTNDVEFETSNVAIGEIRKQRPLDVAVVEYHTSFPSPDEFYTADASPIANTAALRNNFSSVPNSVLDGNKYTGNIYIGGTNEERLDLSDIDAHSLERALFKIDLSTNINTNQIDVATKLTYLEAPTLSNEMVLHVLIVEDTANGNIKYNSVVRKELPSTGGQYISIDWNQGHQETFYASWTNNLSSTSAIGVVAYVQDLTNNRIYQASFVKGSGFSGDFITSNENIVSSASLDFDLYPNPSNDIAMVMFNGITNKEVNWNMFDVNGVSIMNGNTGAGEQGVVIPTNTLASGIYYVQVITEDNRTITKKLVVSH